MILYCLCFDFPDSWVPLIGATIVTCYFAFCYEIVPYLKKKKK